MSEDLQYLQQLCENIPYGAFFRNRDGSISDVNRAALDLFGLNREEFCGQVADHPGTFLVLEDGKILGWDQYPSRVALRSGEKIRDFVAGTYNPLRHEFVWLSFNVTPLFRHGEPSPYRVFVTFNDITRQQGFAHQLSASEERYRTTVNSPIWFVNRHLPGGILTFVNDALCNYLGCTAAELLGKSFFPYVHEADRQQLIRDLDAITVDKPIIESENRIMLPDGGIRWHQWTNTAIFAADGAIVEYQSVGRDVTEQVLAKEALEKSERLFREFFNLPLVGCAISYPNKGWGMVNDKFCEILGYSREDLLALSWTDITHPEDLATNLSLFQQVIAGTIDRYRLKKRFIRKDGSVIWAEIAVQGVRKTDGSVDYFATIIQDITAQKQQDEKIRQGERRAMAILNSVTDPMMLIDMSGTIVMLNDAMAGRLGRSIDQALGTVANDYLPDDLRQTRLAYLTRTMESHQPVRFEDRHGDTYFDNHLFPVVDGNGSITGVVILSRDVTEEKQVESALKESAECFNQALTGPNHILYRLDMKRGCYDYLSPAFEKISGYPIDFFQGNVVGKLRELTHPDDRQVIDRFDEVMRERTGNRINHDYEFRLRKVDGDYCWLHDYTTACFNDAGELECFFGSAYDITARKQMEISLRASEERYRRLISTAYEGIGITDRDYIITYVNERFAEMLAYDPKELIGIPVARLLPEEDRQNFASLAEKRRSGISDRRECWHLRKDGSRAWLLTSSTPILDEHGDFQGCFSMFTDLTARIKAERALIEAHDQLELRVAERTAALAKTTEQLKLTTFELLQAEERERTRIAGELHDQVGQSLLLTKMKLEMLANDLADDTQRQSAAELVSLLENSLYDIRTLIFHLRPPLLETAGLEAALTSLCSALRNDYELKIDFSCSARTLPLTQEVRYSLYQAVRELLLNVAKHAGTGRAALSLRTDGEFVVVCIADSGVGFNQRNAAGKQASDGGFGLYHVQQRIERLGGSFAIASTPGEGTAITLTAPLNATNSKRETPET